MSNSKWKDSTVGEFCPFVYGKGLPERDRNNDGNIPVYGSNGIVGYHTQAWVNNPGIIIGRKGTIGSINLSKTPFWPIDTTFFIENSEERDLRYTYYLLQTLPLKLNNDSAVPGLNRDYAHSVEILVPRLSEQESIAQILGSLDDKIELNRQMNKTLESMAQAIFKSWFVDFDPVKAKAEGRQPEGLPKKIADLFPDSFEESELGDIPKGWKVGKTIEIVEATDYVANGSFASLKENVTYSDFEDYAILIRLVDFNNNFDSSFVYINQNGYDFLKKSRLFGAEIIIANVGANAGTVFRAPKLKKPMTLGPNSIMLINNDYTNYLYYFFTSRFGQHCLNSILSGSAQPKFNKTDFRNITLLIPNIKEIKYFNNIINPIVDKIYAIENENKILAKIRNSLLPKLISGEIRVNDIENDEENFE